MDRRVQFKKDNFDSLLYFNGTEEEIKAYEAYRDEAYRKWKNIIQNPNFRSAEIREKEKAGRRTQFYILSFSTRCPDGLQLSLFDDYGAVAHEDYSRNETRLDIEATYINEKKREDNGFYGSPFSKLLHRLYCLSKNGEIVTIEEE